MSEKLDLSLLLPAGMTRRQAMRALAASMGAAALPGSALAQQDRMLENPGALAQGFANAPGTAYRYLSTRGLPGIGQDVVSMGKMIGSAVAEDPMGFAADALLAPLAAVRDVSEMRALARQARETGDDKTADQMEQLAAMSVFTAIPVAGAVVKRGLKVAKRAAKAHGGRVSPLAVKR